MLNNICCDRARNTLVTITILLVLLIILVYFGSSVSVDDLATYKHEPIKYTVDMFISLFVITMIVERTIAVFFQFTRMPGELRLVQQLIDEIGKYDYLESLKEDVSFEQQKEKNNLKGSIKTTKSSIRIYKKDSVILMTLISLTICTAITISGVRILENFVVVVPAHKSYFQFLDTILSATVLAGGSKGLHEVATAILKFMREITNRKEYSKTK